MKTKKICIWFACCKHGWFLLKLGMQVSIRYDKIDNENRVTGKSKNPSKIKKKWFFFNYFNFAINKDLEKFQILGA
jgi:hypothetical protein